MTERDPTNPPVDYLRHARMWLCAAVLTAMAWACTGTALADSPPAAGSEAAVGVNAGALFNSSRYTPAQIDDQLTALARTGASEVRTDAPWEASEPGPPVLGLVHQYDWRFDDLIARDLATHGLRWVPIIDYSTPWARSVPGDDHSPPSSSSDYANYAAALASRYGPGGSFWSANPHLTALPVQTYEIWNEPDNQVYWNPRPNPAGYAGLYLSARASIHAVQPDAHVIVGGLSRPAAFIPAMLASHPGMQAQVDGVGIHPYASTPTGVLASVRATRQILRAVGLGATPLYITEFGWATSPAHVWGWAPPQQRTGYISDTISMLGHTDCGVADVLLYAWTTLQRDPANPEDWFGISPPSGNGSSDTAAFAGAVRQAVTPAPTQAICAGTGPLVLAQKTVSWLRSKLPAHRRSRHHRRRHPPAASRR